MEAERKNRLLDAGVNVDSALERFMGNEKMLEKYLGRFLEEKSYQALLAAVAADDAAQAAAAAHTLKSVCGTIGCEKMQGLVVGLEAHIKNNEWDQAVASMPGVTEEYEKICVALRG